MNNTFIRFARTFAFLLFALIGGMMALLFMASTAIAISILYVIARLRGRPFGIRHYWRQRRTTQRHTPKKRPFHPSRSEVIDVEVREPR